MLCYNKIKPGASLPIVIVPNALYVITVSDLRKTLSEAESQISVVQFKYDRLSHTNVEGFSAAAAERMRIAALEKQVLVAEPSSVMSLLAIFIVTSEELFKIELTSDPAKMIKYTDNLYDLANMHYAIREAGEKSFGGKIWFWRSGVS